MKIMGKAFNNGYPRLLGNRLKTSVIIPAHNEGKHIYDIVEGCKQYGNVIVVDDGSTDDTAKISMKAGAHVLKLSKKMGKGFALRVGIERVIENGSETVVFIDGDGQHRPEDVSRLLDKINGGADIVLAQRQGEHMPSIKRFGNWFLQRVFNSLFGYFMEDTQCGLKAMKVERVNNIMWESNGYFVDTEIAARASINSLKIEQIKIPIIYHDPTKGTTVLDGVRIFVKMLSLRWRIKN
ncbi:MAG: glycosyltransferase family 2 protein [Candidatus Altiarchaeota archaeon]|nr:glycosyltransferase family 2 protein [Candidatus Altiarchaeota archaeon]